MSEHDNDPLGFNRRDFLRGGSLATVMTMLGGVELLAQTNAAPGGETASQKPKVKVGVIGLWTRGREIVNTLALLEQADVAAICDTYPAALKRAASAAPNATQTEDYKTILANKDIPAVIIATPTATHKEIALAALKAGKDVYCEAPLANTIEDARVIALAAKASKLHVFQAGLQMRADPLRIFLLPFVRSGQLGKMAEARAQWHKKTSWRSSSPNPEREKALNWRLDKAISLGLVGEVGIHAIDQAGWYLGSPPTAITGFGSITFWNDGREVPDTVQLVLEFPNGIRMLYDATLANSFDGDYEMLYGSDAAMMMRESKAWMFKEVDSPAFGWEVYASKTQFYKETGIALVADASKAKPATPQPTPGQDTPLANTPLYYALQNFLANSVAFKTTTDDYKASYGADDLDGLADQLSKVARKPAADYLEGFQSVVTAVKANEAIASGKRIELKPEWYELK
ncbi:MAG TPA: Gfo/Idh/MocA family oxidoreductase [Candidatus Acidoferrum sp.]|nr:Gfo/Idh/MocA family oxidoreductase [Candidatus Acidoferrum sp.]